MLKMNTLKLPPGGLALEATPNTDKSSTKSELKPAQVFQLNLASGLLEDLLKEARTGGKGVHIILGKSPVCILVVGNQFIANTVLHPQALQFGNMSHKVSTAQMLRTDLRRLSEVKDGTCRYTLALEGRFSHKVEMRKQEKVTAEVDPAILQLQNSLAEAKRLKESNTYVE